MEIPSLDYLKSRNLTLHFKQRGLKILPTAAATRSLTLRWNKRKWWNYSERKMQLKSLRSWIYTWNIPKGRTLTCWLTTHFRTRLQPARSFESKASPIVLPATHQNSVNLVAQLLVAGSMNFCTRFAVKCAKRKSSHREKRQAETMKHACTIFTCALRAIATSHLLPC